MNVAGLVLAAGEGSRFGGPKVASTIAGVPLVERVWRVLAAGGCDPVIVVLGAHAERVRQATQLPTTVDNPDWPTGMASSLRRGLAAVPDGVDAAVVALGDQPLIGAEVIERLVAAARDGAAAAVATYGGAPRNPVLLARRVFADVLSGAHGDVGARDWLRSHPEMVVKVACDDAGDPFDVDTPADLEVASARARGEG